MIKNYYNMYKTYGVKLVYSYFFYSHYFDIKHGVDTHLWVPEDDMYNDQNMYYLGSWSNTIKKTYSLMEKFLGDNINDYSFIDMGCGKGRVVLIWEDLVKQHKRTTRVSGIDMNVKLIDIAKKNHTKMFNTEGNFSIQNVCKLSLDKDSNNIIIYMFNPFGEEVMSSMLSQLTDKNVIILYVCPVYSELLLKLGYKEIYNQDAWHPELQIKVFTNHNLKTKEK